MSVLETRVYLCKDIPLDNEYKHTLYFPDFILQHAYFKTKSYKEYVDFSFQQKDSVMRIPLPYEEAVLCNYVCYQNKYVNNGKWYFAFITGYEYKGDDQTNITIETDVMQTYMFDYEVKPSFIEREHCDDDTIGLHTIPENIEMGEYICQNVTHEPSLTNNLDIVVGITAGADGTKLTGNMYQGMYSGITYKRFSYYDIQGINEFIGSYSSSTETTNDAIVCMFIAPGVLTREYDTNGVMVSGNNVLTSGTVKTSDVGLDFNNRAFLTYTPKNKKLYCYPYRYLLCSNNNGGSAIYQYEHFKNNVRFRIFMTLTPGCSIRIEPFDYKTDTNNYVNSEEGLNLGKFPICNWASDEYTNWLTQNSVNIGLNIASGIGQIVGGIAIGAGTGGVGWAIGSGSIAGGVSTIAGVIAQNHQMSMTPPQTRGNTNCGDVITSMGNNTFSFYDMRIKDEYLKYIDDYFSMFGYKCDRVKIPNKNHRTNWWYTKTIDVNIVGVGVPVEDLKTIKDCYNRGVTFWRDSNAILDYSRANDII